MMDHDTDENLEIYEKVSELIQNYEYCMSLKNIADVHIKRQVIEKSTLRN
jgi:hypothetical protein